MVAAERRDDGCHYRSKPDDGVDLVVHTTDAAKWMRAMKGAGEMLGGMGAAVADKGGAGADAAALLRPDARTPPKLGDAAMWGTNATLAVRRGDAYVEVTPPIMHDPASHPGYPLVRDEEKRAIATRVAEKVLARLPS